MRARFVGLALLLSCAGKSEEPPAPFVDDAVTGRATNAEGTAYPTDHLGGRPRAGSKRGDRIPNFSFQGYVDSDKARGLETISLADYYDPTQKRAKVLHLMEAAYWCTVCDGQTREMAPTKAALAEKGVVVVQAIMNGARRNVGPSLLEVDQWMQRFPTWFTVVIDDRAKRIGSVTEVDAVPWNALVDLRTMEILYAGAGRPVSYERFVDAGVEWVTSNPPSY